MQTWVGSINRRSFRCRVIVPGLMCALVGCATMESVPPERLSELRSKATACSDALPAISHHGVDRFGAVRASATGPDADLIERNFQDCVFGRGRWAAWVAGQPAPMLEPLGTDDPDPTPGRRVP
jgi:hypothetical protein